MQIWKKKLATSGFSHLEVMLVIVVFAVLASVGYFVYKDSQTSNTVHAGGYKYQAIGSLSTQYCVDGGKFIRALNDCEGLGASGQQVVDSTEIIHACTQIVPSGYGKLYAIHAFVTANWIATHVVGIANTQNDDNGLKPNILNYFGISIIRHGSSEAQNPNVAITSNARGWLNGVGGGVVSRYKTDLVTSTAISTFASWNLQDSYRLYFTDGNGAYSFPSLNSSLTPANWTHTTPYGPLLDPAFLPSC